MILQVDLEPLRAMKLFYASETLGVSASDVAKFHKRCNVKLPPVIEEFLLRYAYFNVNRGMSQIWHPINMKLIKAACEKSTEADEFLLFGETSGQLLGIKTTDTVAQNPKLWYLTEQENKVWSYDDAKLDLSEFLQIMFLECPAVYNNVKVCNTPDDIVEILAAVNNPALNELIEKAKRPRQIICWNRTAQEFFVVGLRPGQEVLLRFSGFLTMDDLEGLFSKEFYESPGNCDYRHALDLLEEIIERLETSHGKSMLNLAEKYQLAGRCCWALKEWGRADEWFAKAKHIFTNELSLTIDKIQSFYETLGNYYLLREDTLKSQEAYSEVDKLSDFLGRNGARSKGGRLVRQAQIFVEYEQFEKAIELYNQALKIYQTDPKECKYDIARCQQLKGDANKILKHKQNKNKQ